MGIRGFVAALAMGVAACSGGGGEPSRLPAGQFDPAFGQGGLFELAGGDFAGLEARALSMNPDERGRLILAGWTAQPSSASSAKALFARVLPGGVLDSAFANGGTLRVAGTANQRSEGRWGFPAPGGRTTIVDARQERCPDPPQCTSAPPMVGFRRLLPDGTLDGSAGETVFGPMEEIQSAALPDGSIVFLASIFNSVAGNNIAVRRLDAAGRPDGAFAGNADSALLCPELSYASPHDARMARLASGKFLFVRMNTNTTLDRPRRKCVTRLNPDGTLDTDYGAQGRLYIDDADLAGARIAALLERGDGGVALVLNRDAVGRQRVASILWLTESGAVDASRGTEGVTSPLPELATVTAAAVQCDGKLVLGGWPNDPATGERTFDWPRLVRFDAAGRIDAGFGPSHDGVAPLVVAGRRLHPLHLAQDRGGAIYATGFTGTSVIGFEATRVAVAKLSGGGC
jgi:uncharacterized delta-60 repeat protein